MIVCVEGGGGGALGMHGHKAMVVYVSPPMPNMAISYTQIGYVSQLCVSRL